MSDEEWDTRQLPPILPVRSVPPLAKGAPPKYQVIELPERFTGDREKNAARFIDGEEFSRHLSEGGFPPGVPTLRSENAQNLPLSPLSQ